MELGFEKASSENLPAVDLEMLTAFFSSNTDFISAEIRNVKTAKASKADYGDKAIGYVQLKRDGDTCIVNARISPEHKIHKKQYRVCAIINEVQEVVISCKCLDCTAAEGGCKHGVAFLTWLHRRSEEPSVTSTTCYWKKPALPQVGRTNKCMSLATLTNKTPSPLEHVSGSFRNKVLSSFGNASGGLFDLFKENKFKLISIYHLYMQYSSDNDNKNANDFLQFVSENMIDDETTKAEAASRQQANCSDWYELRFGRITASRIYEAAKCKTLTGALTESIMGASKPFDTCAMSRGRKLEPIVLEEVSKLRNIQINRSGLLLNKKYPVLGASPDGISSDFCIEVKCPSKLKSIDLYVQNGQVNIKYLLQIQTQMYFANKIKGLFCIAAPDFEETKEVCIYDISFDKNLCEKYFDLAVGYWQKAIFPIFLDM